MFVSCEQELWDRVRPRYDAIMERHARLPVVVAEDGCGNGSGGPSALDLDVHKKWLVNHSKQQGWLKVDLILGAWALINVYGLSTKELDQFKKFVNMEAINIYNVPTLRNNVPEEMSSGGSGLGEGGGQRRGG